MTFPRLRGVIVATVLPFDESGAIDWPSYQRLLDYCTTPGGICAVFVNGHAGESASLSPGERRDVIRFTRRAIGPKTPLLSGVIAQSTDEAIQQALGAKEAGADCAVLFPVPLFQGASAMPPAAPVAFVQAVARATEMPIALFQYPLASGFGYNTETLAQLAQVPGVCLIKEGTGDPTIYRDNLRRIHAVAPQVSIMATNSTWLIDQAMIGGDGILSGLASLTPHWLIEGWKAVEAGDLRAARAASDKLYAIMRNIYGAPRFDMHTRIKAGLRHLGIIRNATPRGPLLPLAEASETLVRRTVDESGLAALIR